jgi:hypothetical protein
MDVHSACVVVTGREGGVWASVRAVSELEGVIGRMTPDLGYRAIRGICGRLRGMCEI